MLSLDRHTVERILTSLDGYGYILSEFELYRVNNQPKLLGRGGFSVVYEMLYKERPDIHYALKVIGFEKHVVTSKQFWETVRLQYNLCEQSPFVMRLLGAREVLVSIDDSGDVLEVQEPDDERWNEDGLLLQFILMEKLEDIIVKDRFANASLTQEILYEEEEVIKFAMEIGQAIQLAHSNSILHRDIKLENIFWDEIEQCYKLGDFGISKYVEGGNAETVVYTDGYGAPEIERRLNDYYNATADIYSFGITLYLLLNGLRFPGSEGYYVNMVQYDPKYIFPAPENASEAMTRVIRRMCSFRKEDRYQSMAEVLMDLSRLLVAEEMQNKLDYSELSDLATETYREGKRVENDLESIDKESLYKERPQSRAQRIQSERINDRIYRGKSVKYFIGLTMLFALIMRGMQHDSAFIFRWQFWVLSIMVFIEAILLRVKEFHIVFGITTVVFAGYSIYTLGLTVPHILLIMSVIISIPIVTAAGAAASGLWMLLMYTDKLPWLGFIEKNDASWILIIFMFIALCRLMFLRIDFNKTSYRRASIGIFVFDILSFVMIIIGILLLVLQKFNVLTIPNMVRELHLVRVGISLFIIMGIIYDKMGYLDDDLAEDENTEENGEKIKEDDICVDQ